MRGALEQQMQEKVTQGREHKLHEANCFPENHTARRPEDTSRPWTSTTQFMSARQEVGRNQMPSKKLVTAVSTLLVARKALTTVPK